jgi:hypothetical protein
VLAAVAAIAFGLDASFLTRASVASTTSLEQGLLDRFRTEADAPRLRGARPGGGCEAGPLPG